MRKLTLAGVCLAVLAAFAAVSVAGAAAAEPALYECVPAKTEVVHYKKGKPGKEKSEEKTVYTGEYSSLKNCEKGKLYTKDKTRVKGPNPGPEGKESAVELSHTAPFAGTGSGANLNVAGIGGVRCLEASFSGKFTGPKSAGDIVATFKKCVYAGKECTSAGQSAGTIVTDALSGGAGYLAGEGTGSPKVGTDISPESASELAEFVCVGAAHGPIQIAVTGSVIGEASPVNKFTNTATFTFRQKESEVGVNEWTKFQEWPAAQEDRLTAHVCGEGLGGGTGEEICPEPLVTGAEFAAAQEGVFTGHLSNAGEELEVKA